MDFIERYQLHRTKLDQMTVAELRELVGRGYKTVDQMPDDPLDADLEEEGKSWCRLLVERVDQAIDDLDFHFVHLMEEINVD